MSFPEQIDPLKQGLKAAERGASDLMERIKSEFEIAERLAVHNEQHGDAWKALVAKAMEQFQKDLAGGDVTLLAAIKAAEQTLAPIGAELKTYTIHCCGHAHIDMNWMWPWPETVSATVTRSARWTAAGRLPVPLQDRPPPTRMEMLA